MRKQKILSERLKAIEHEIAVLETFRATPQMNRFKRQLHGEHSFIKKQIASLTTNAESFARLREEKNRKANENRSEKMKRTWRYLKNIQQNYFPEKGLRELRTMFKKQRQGLETDIPELIWRNPSP